jgi:hypothetical protein
MNLQSALHVQSGIDHGLAGEYHAKFWKEVSAVKLSRSHLKSVVFHKFRGHENEFEFLKFIATDEQELESLRIEPLKGSFASAIELNKMIDKRFRAWASEVLPVPPKVDIVWKLHEATDLSIDDPFYC